VLKAQEAHFKLMGLKTLNQRKTAEAIKDILTFRSKAIQYSNKDAKTVSYLKAKEIEVLHDFEKKYGWQAGIALETAIVTAEAQLPMAELVVFDKLKLMIVTDALRRSGVLAIVSEEEAEPYLEETENKWRKFLGTD